MSALNSLVAKFFYRIISSGTYIGLKNEAEKKSILKKFGSIGADAKIAQPMLLINPEYITIGKNFTANYNLRLEAWDKYMGENFVPRITIGDNVSVGTDVHIGCIDQIKVGHNVLMGSRIFISDHSHGYINEESFKMSPVERPLFSKGPVIIEDNVWVGEGACILPGVTIGSGAVIGANAVVTRDVPANAVVAGIPAKIIKQVNL